MKTGIENHYIFEGWENVNGIWRRFWRDRSKNLVVTTGLNEYQKEFWTGAAYTAALFVGLVNNANFGSIALTDTAAKIVTGVPAGGDNQWRESTSYSESVRQTLLMGTAVAGAIDNSSSVATFTVTTGFTLKGAFVVTNSTKGGTSGILIGAAAAASTQAFTTGQQVRIIISSTLANA